MFWAIVWIAFFIINPPLALVCFILSALYVSIRY